MVARHDTHDRRLISLEDNMPTAYAVAKGRACSPALNYYCRRRTACALSANVVVAAPWVQTALMPADEASRVLVGQHGGLLEGDDEGDGSEIRGPACPGKVPGTVAGKVPSSAHKVSVVYH